MSIISPCLCKDKFFHSNSNLTNSVDVKCLYEKCRLIFVSTRIYALFKKLFLLLQTALLKCSIYCKVKVFWQLDTPWYNNSCFTHTAWKVPKYGVFSGPYFPVFGLNTERYFVSLRIQSECGKIRTRKNSVFGHISHSATKI